jgi:hypothetical protein
MVRRSVYFGRDTRSILAPAKLFGGWVRSSQTAQLHQAAIVERKWFGAKFSERSLLQKE